MLHSCKCSVGENSTHWPCIVSSFRRTWYDLVCVSTVGGVGQMAEAATAREVSAINSMKKKKQDTQMMSFLNKDDTI